VSSIVYFGFCNLSGGSSDSTTLAIGHRGGDSAIVDWIGEASAIRCDHSSLLHGVVLRSHHQKSLATNS